MKKCIWIGPVVDKNYLTKENAISPAANEWQINFLISLRKSNYDVIIFNYLPKRYFPYGSLFPVIKELNLPFRYISNSYINLFFFRSFSLFFSLFIKIIFQKNFKYIFTYNSSIPHNLNGIIFKNVFKKKWINIQADNYAFKGPTLTVFLSFYYFNKSTISSKFHLDGGVYKIKPCEEVQLNNSNKKVILFAGALNKWTGIEDFAILFSSSSKNVYGNFELHIYGKGHSDLLFNIAKSDNRVKVFGFVDEDELHSKMCQCFCFVNPRPLNDKLGDLNFPSKLLLYLAYKKLILSTRSPGLSDLYNDVLIYYDPINVNIDNLLDYLLIYNNISYNILKNRIISFNNINSWDNKVSSLMLKV